MVAAIAIIAGLLGGLLAGGRVVGIGEINLRYEVLVVAAFVVQAVARGRLSGTRATDYASVVWIAVSIALLVLLVTNWRQAGALIVAAGVVMNLDVVLANAGMPVMVPLSREAIESASASGGFYFLASRSPSIAAWMGDVLPLRVLGQTFVLSAGDVLLAVGVATVIAAAMIEAHPSDTERTE